MPGSHYRRNHLVNVILRVDFAPLPVPNPLPTQSPLAERVQDQFPVVTGQPIMSVVLNMTAMMATAPVQQIAGMQWDHRKEANGTKILFLSPSHLSLEYGERDYDHFPPFRAEFEAAFNALTQLHPSMRAARIGLRYVNRIKFDQGNPLDWDGIIAPPLRAAVTAALPEGAGMVRSMHQMQAKTGDSMLLLHYGIHNPEYPAVVSRREFVLDIDAHHADEMPANEVLQKIDALNKACEAAFESCIAEGLRLALEPI